MADAEANGDGYQPQPDGNIAIVLDPGDIPNKPQTTIVVVPVNDVFPGAVKGGSTGQIPTSFTGSETAWAEGEEFGGGNWSMFSKIII